MNSDDYTDAFEKILILSTKNFYLVISIIVTCSMYEKRFNFYYGALVIQLCKYDLEYQKCLNHVFKNILKKVYSLHKKHITNLAHLCSFLIKNGNINLEILKNLNFSNLDAKTSKFLNVFLTDLSLNQKKLLKIAEKSKVDSKLLQSLNLFLKLK